MTKVFRVVTGLMGGLALSAVATVANDSEWGRVAGQQVVEVSGEVSCLECRITMDTVLTIGDWTVPAATSWTTYRGSSWTIGGGSW